MMISFISKFKLFINLIYKKRNFDKGNNNNIGWCEKYLIYLHKNGKNYKIYVLYLNIYIEFEQEKNLHSIIKWNLCWIVIEFLFVRFNFFRFVLPIRGQILLFYRKLFCKKIRCKKNWNVRIYIRKESIRILCLFYINYLSSSSFFSL